MGLQKEAIRTQLGNKTTVVTHLAEVQASSLCDALNEKLLGARVLRTGAHKVAEDSITLLDLLADADSGLSRGLLFLQALLFAAGLTLDFRNHALGGLITSDYLFVVVLGHSIVRRAILSIAACRMTIQLLMFSALVGALLLHSWREAATISLLVAGSEWLLRRVNILVESALSANINGASTQASKVVPGAKGPQLVPIEEIGPGDIVLLRQGEMVPIDGEVRKADGLQVDESSVTGEAMPVQKAVGSKVLSGTVVISGAAEVKCTAAAENSFQGRIGRAVEEARLSRSNTEELVNQVAAWYTPLVVLGSVIVAIVTGEPARGLATLVSACPCALVAAAPAAQSCTLVMLLSETQVLVKSTKALENMAKIARLGVDKTGTLTEGHFALMAAKPLPGSEGKDQTELLGLLAAVEAQDPHPLANCIVSAHMGCCTDFVSGVSGPRLSEVSHFTRVESKGVYGIVEDQMVGAGSREFLEEMSISLPTEAEEACAAYEREHGAATTIFMTLDEDVAMILWLTDKVRDDAKAAISRFRELGVTPSLLTGDTRRPADAVAMAVGLDAQNVMAGLKPMDKEAWVRKQRGQEMSERSAQEGLSAQLLSAEEQQVAAADLESSEEATSFFSLFTRQQRPIIGMLGDGLNDGPALAAADVGIAVSAGLQLTVDAADVVVNQGADLLLRLTKAIATAQDCQRLVLQNLALAAAIKGASLGLAATGYIGLSTGVLSDTGSFLAVMANSLRPLAW